LRHRFYLKPRREQLQIQLMIGFFVLLVILVTFYISWKSGVYWVGGVVFGIILSVIAPFFDTPSLKKSGDLIYYSPLFLAEKPQDGKIILHGGTLFDYVFVIDRRTNGKQRTNFILQQYLEGLLNLIEVNQNKKTENFKISGTSYIINERTAQRVGFKVVKTDFLQKAILMVNYFNVLLTYSIAKGSLSFPKLSDTKTFETTIDKLIKQKDFIRDLNEKLKDNQTNR